MADDIDIEEHDVLDNPRIKTIFPDIACIKAELINYKDKDNNDFDEESYETYQQDLTDPEILECSVVLEDWGDSLKNNPCFCSDCKILFPTENALDSHEMTAHSLLVAVARGVRGSGDFGGGDCVARVGASSSDWRNDSTLSTAGEADINDSVEESYEKCQQELTDLEILECSVVLEDWGDSLKNNPCFCSDCKILFATENALDSHKMTVHSFLVAVGRNKAIKSTTKSSIAARLQFEPDSDMGISNLRNHCNKVLPDKTSLQKHSDEILTRKFSCNDCDLEFESEISLQRHLRTLPSVLMYCCPICSCCFKFSKILLSHMVDQHQVDVEKAPQRVKTTYKCRFCPKILRNNKSYNVHIQYLHPDLYKENGKDKTRTEKFECQPCNSTFPSKSCISSIAAKLKYETDLNTEISNLYTYCNQVFPEEESVLKQSDKHLTRKFSCDVCDLKFESKTSLQLHLKSLSGCLLYCCPICSCCFKFTKKLLSHMVVQHRVDVDKAPQRVKTTYKCLFCPEILWDYKSYNIHIQYWHSELYKKIGKDKTHTEKFRCQPCNLTFPSAHSEKIHRISRHAKSKTYSKSVGRDKQWGETSFLAFHGFTVRMPGPSCGKRNSERFPRLATQV
ncbi:zinc finger protein 423-like [Melitaea cinxia]|uniref:zinc finger protein 423-like n=1 Tax=Melitaea cinxia TaxID=113334 RepID=UPI001E26FA09|nr:zinc finger protein 423-like [Melitaea cinxia]